MRSLPRQLPAPGTLRCCKNTSTATPAPGESLGLSACKASPHANFIYGSRFPQTSSNLHRWPLTPRSKNTEARDSGPPSSPGQMCRCALGRRPRLAPSHPCWRAGRGPPGPSASVLGRVSAVPGPLLCVGVRRGVGVKARPSLDCPGLAILSPTRWSWERAEGWGEASGRIMAEAGAEAACPPRTGGRRERRELWGLLVF